MSAAVRGSVPVPYSPSQEEADWLVRITSDLQVVACEADRWGQRPHDNGQDAMVILHTPLHPRANTPARDGGRDTVRITVHSSGPDENDLAFKVAQVIARVVPGVSYLSRLMTNAWEARDAARDAQKTAERRLARVLTSKPPMALGEWIVRIIKRESGDEVWLLNPDGEFRRQGFLFTSMEQLWRAHPALRPIAWGEDKHGLWLRVAPVTLIDTEPT